MLMYVERGKREILVRLAFVVKSEPERIQHVQSAFADGCKIDADLSQAYTVIQGTHTST